MTKKIFIKIFIFSLCIISITAILILVVLHSYFDILNKTEVFRLAAALAAAIIISVAAAVFISVKITKTIVGPIKELGNNLDNPDNIKVFSELQGVVDEIKKQKEKQKALMGQKKQFTANLSHELKTPLTSIAGYAELIEAGIAKEEDIKPFASTIRAQALRLVSLSEDIIQLSQLEENYDSNSISFSSIDLFEIAGSCVETLKVNAESRGININLEGESVFIKGNSSLIEELIYNLCDNAIRYNKENGSVLVTITDNEISTVLTVKDTGIGIDEKYHDKVFERFFRVDKSRSKKTGGTGLGLAIVKHIVSLHGAELKISSKLGKGTEISIYFKK